MDKEQEEFWDIIEMNYVTEQIDDEINIFNNHFDSSFTVMQVAPGIIIMIKDDLYG